MYISTFVGVLTDALSFNAHVLGENSDASVRVDEKLYQIMQIREVEQERERCCWCQRHGRRGLIVSRAVAALFSKVEHKFVQAPGW